MAAAKGLQTLCLVRHGGVHFNVGICKDQELPLIWTRGPFGKREMMDASVAPNLSAKSTDEGKTNSYTAVVNVQKYSSTEKHEKKPLLCRRVEDSSDHDRKVTDITLLHELKSNLRGSNHTLSEEVGEQKEVPEASSSTYHMIIIITRLYLALGARSLVPLSASISLYP